MFVGITFHIATEVGIIALFSVKVFGEDHVFDIYFDLLFHICTDFDGFVGVCALREDNFVILNIEALVVQIGGVGKYCQLRSIAINSAKFIEKTINI